MSARNRARNGQGTISPRQLKNGTTVYDAWTPPLIAPETGKKRRYPKRGLLNEKEAAKWIAKTISDVEAGNAVIEKRGGLTVDQIAERWATSSALKASTTADHVYNYRNMARARIGSEPIASLRSTHIDALFASLSKKYAPSVMILLIRALSNFWDYAVRDGKARSNIIKESPWRAKLYREAEDRKAEKLAEREDDEDGIIKVFTPEQVRTLVEMERNEGYRLLWQFIVLTGARRGEALGLRWSEVDFEKQVIWLSDNTVRAGGQIMTVDTPKGNRKRRIYASDDVLEVLQEQKRHIERARKWFDDWQEHDLVFPRAFRHRIAKEPVGGRMDPKAVSEVFLRRTRSLRLPEIGLHGLRHTCASAMYANGVDIKTIQDHLGHRVDVTTLVYVHTDAATKREAVTRVVDYINRTKE
ncbi:tyrosine-type recombinase/integrase [Nonomuraea lactucae]|uniref:tyrosine-type recombinase/integrase n=1 Tax=Nonomuraea lactucae TaxID=2249762 RepID=UPI000DE42FAE|nr:site-specific integrase [Nonomuraea lactucae]